MLYVKISEKKNSCISGLTSKQTVSGIQNFIVSSFNPIFHIQIHHFT